MDGWMGRFPRVTSRGHRLLGSDRFHSLTKPRGMLRAAAVLSPQSTHVGRAPMWAVTVHWPPKCTEAGIVRILTRRRDEGRGGGRGEGSTNVHAPCLSASLAL